MFERENYRIRLYKRTYMTILLRELQNSIWAKFALLTSDSDFSQIAYGQKDMSICEKPNRRQNHQIWPPKRVLQLPHLDCMFQRTILQNIILRCVKACCGGQKIP